MRPMPDSMRLDKWLWAARLYKTRALAVQGVELGRVLVNGLPAKAGRDLRIGDKVSVQQAGFRVVLTVLRLSAQRGSATVARTLYAESAESVSARERALQQRALAPEPAATRPDGRPTKRDRRSLADWQRWSASVDE
ncbi:MAG TPA: RNA-binding S4 domain-containing protein [Burkholderiaceae bacterium]|nr:RNA-binding S4 domain-containing protein [Burkholderiaceae bacterium]